VRLKFSYVWPQYSFNYYVTAIICLPPA